MNHTVESVAGERGIPPEELLRASAEIGIPKESVTDSLSDSERTHLLEARTVQAFAEKLDVSRAQLLTELDEIGMPKKSVDAYVSVDEQWQREHAQSVEILARDEGIAVDSLLRKLEEIGRTKPSVGSLVTDEEQEQISPFVRTHHLARTIREIREYRGLTRAQVAEKVAVSERQLVKIEAGEVDLVDPKQGERLEELAVALDVKDFETAATPIHDAEPRQDPVAISAQVTPQARSGFARIRERYGWSIAQVMELAPLMFGLLAEGSLARRRRRLQELRSACEEAPLELRDFLVRFRQEPLKKETRSIQDRNLRYDSFSGGASPDPLSAYLFELAGKLGDDASMPVPPAGNPRRGERLLLDWLLPDKLRCQACNVPIGPEHVYCPSCGARIGRNPGEG